MQTLKDKVNAFLGQLHVVDLLGFTKTRVGKPSDGGYIVVDELCRDTKHVYTFGVGTDVSFELEFVRRYPGTKFTLFDPTIPALPEEHPDFTFVKRGMPQACHSPGFAVVPKGSILKMDIEWNEWETLELMSEETLCKFDQLLIEFHAFSVECPGNKYSSYFNGVLIDFKEQVDGALFLGYAGVLEKLNKHFHVFHVHANNSLPKQVVGKAELPPLLEVSFVRKDLVGGVTEYTGPFPSPALDHPNKPDRPDITEYETFLPGAW